MHLRTRVDKVCVMMKIAKPAQKHRKQERVSTSMPVKMGDMQGMTSNVSAGGVYFEINSSLPLGSEISFEIEMHTALGLMIMKCRGQIIRTEQHGDRIGVAVKMNESQLTAIA